MEPQKQRPAAVREYRNRHGWDELVQSSGHKELTVNQWRNIGQESRLIPGNELVVDLAMGAASRSITQLFFTAAVTILDGISTLIRSKIPFIALILRRYGKTLRYLVSSCSRSSRLDNLNSLTVRLTVALFSLACSLLCSGYLFPIAISTLYL